MNLCDSKLVSDQLWISDHVQLVFMILC